MVYGAASCLRLLLSNSNCCCQVCCRVHQVRRLSLSPSFPLSLHPAAAAPSEARLYTELECLFHDHSPRVLLTLSLSSKLAHPLPSTARLQQASLQPKDTNQSSPPLTNKHLL